MGDESHLLQLRKFGAHELANFRASSGLDLFSSFFRPFVSVKHNAASCKFVPVFLPGRGASDRTDPAGGDENTLLAQLVGDPDLAVGSISSTLIGCLDWSLN